MRDKQKQERRDERRQAEITKKEKEAKDSYLKVE